jgi:hypothetical protein
MAGIFMPTSQGTAFAHLQRLCLDFIMKESVKMNSKRQIDDRFAALILIEILFEKRLINKTTYINIQRKYAGDIAQNPQAA